MSSLAGSSHAFAIDFQNGQESVPYHNGAEWRMARVNPDNSFTDVGKITVGANTDPRGTEAAGIGGRVLVFVRNDSGTLKRRFSINGGADWEDV